MSGILKEKTLKDTYNIISSMLSVPAPTLLIEEGDAVRIAKDETLEAVNTVLRSFAEEYNELKTKI